VIASSQLESGQGLITAATEMALGFRNCSDHLLGGIYEDQRFGGMERIHQNNNAAIEAQNIG
jgi:hypothetical protein